MEMRGQVDRGIPFLRGRVGDWGDGNLFAVHNWWHLSLFELEAGHHAEVLAIYDRRLHNADAAGVPLEMLDASALLWRLKLDGIDSGNRFAELADAWASRTADAAVVRVQRPACDDGVRRCRAIRRRRRCRSPSWRRLPPKARRSPTRG